MAENGKDMVKPDNLRIEFAPWCEGCIHADLILDVDEFEIGYGELQRSYDLRCCHSEACNRQRKEYEAYKIYYDGISKLNDCNNCGKRRECEYVPRLGEVSRINCPLWKGENL